MRGVSVLSACAAAAVLLSGCAALQPGTPEEAVAKRALARYDALIAMDYRSAYTYLTPAYRGEFSYESWIRTRPPRARFVSASIVSVDCPSADLCNAEVRNGYHSPQGVRAAPKGVIERVTAERWVRVGEQWWLFQNR